MSYTAIDLSKLPAPAIVEPLSYEIILGEMLARLVELDPDLTALVESDPAMKVLQVAAYREFLLRQRVNDGTRAVMLAYAAGTDLDQLGANLNVQRQLVSPGDPEAVPPVEPVYESDDRFRRRIQLAPEGMSVAGPSGAYEFHTLTADPRVKDVSVLQGEPGDVVVVVLSTEGDGTASEELRGIVGAALADETVRPLNDTVIVESAEIVTYTVAAELEIFDGPDAETVRQAAEDAVAAYVAECHAVGAVVALSGLDGALHRPGVRRANRTLPATDLVPGPKQARLCTAITVEIADDE